MRVKNSDDVGVLSQLSVDDALHGVGLELLLKAEELMYAKGSLTEEECYEVGSALYLLSTVLASIIQENAKVLKTIGVQLPSTVGAVRIKNPYYDGRSAADGEDRNKAPEGGKPAATDLNDNPF